MWLTFYTLGIIDKSLSPLQPARMCSMTYSWSHCVKFQCQCPDCMCHAFLGCVSQQLKCVLGWVPGKKFYKNSLQPLRDAPHSLRLWFIKYMRCTPQRVDQHNNNLFQSPSSNNAVLFNTNLWMLMYLIAWRHSMVTFDGDQHYHYN